MSGAMVHRITTSTAAVVNDPAPEELSALIAEVDRSGRGSFLIAERRGGSGERYLQAVRQAAGWSLELRDGGPDRLFRAELADLGTVEAAFTSWTCGSTAWRQLPWARVPRDVRWLPTSAALAPRA